MTNAERELLRQAAAAVLMLLLAMPDRSVDQVLSDAAERLAAALARVDAA